MNGGGGAVFFGIFALGAERPCPGTDNKFRDGTPVLSRHSMSSDIDSTGLSGLGGDIHQVHLVITEARGTLVSCSFLHGRSNVLVGYRYSSIGKYTSGNEEEHRPAERLGGADLPPSVV